MTVLLQPGQGPISLHPPAGHAPAAPGYAGASEESALFGPRRTSTACGHRLCHLPAAAHWPSRRLESAVGSTGPRAAPATPAAAGAARPTAHGRLHLKDPAISTDHPGMAWDPHFGEWYPLLCNSTPGSVRGRRHAPIDGKLLPLCCHSPSKKLKHAESLIPAGRLPAKDEITTALSCDSNKTHWHT